MAPVIINGQGVPIEQAPPDSVVNRPSPNRFTQQMFDTLRASLNSQGDRLYKTLAEMDNIDLQLRKMRRQLRSLEGSLEYDKMKADMLIRMGKTNHPDVKYYNDLLGLKEQYQADIKKLEERKQALLNDYNQQKAIYTKDKSQYDQHRQSFGGPELKSFGDYRPLPEEYFETVNRLGIKMEELNETLKKIGPNPLAGFDSGNPLTWIPTAMVVSTSPSAVLGTAQAQQRINNLQQDVARIYQNLNRILTENGRQPLPSTSGISSLGR